MLFLGVDGGGTKTAFTIIDKQGNTIFNYVAGTAHIDQIKKQGLIQLFENFLKELSHKNIDMDDISYCFFGMPGYSEAPLWDQQIHEVLDFFFSNKYTCGNDSVSGWAAGLAGKAGINLIAGTGTICLGVDDNACSVRSGGWGHLIGDEASGFWLGKNLMEIFTKQADGRAEKSALYSIFREELLLKDDNDLINLVYNQWEGSREKIANLSRIISPALQQNDPYIEHLMDQCAQEMASMVFAVANKLDFVGDIPVSYSGGVFNLGAYILDPFRLYLGQHKKNFSITKPLLTPDRGSALYAAKLGGLEITPTFITNLQ
ncbi:MAG: N-acetylglucosamine kinase [Chitinophagaceae bacterium]